MIRKVLRHAGWLSLVGGVGASACSSPAPTADAYVNTSVSGSSCSYNGPLTAVGVLTPGGDLPSTQPNGTKDGNQTITVACTVQQSGGGYDIELEASTTGGGTTIFRGTATTQGSSSISATVEDSTVFPGPVEADNCTLTYQFTGSPVSAGDPIAPGKIWGHVSCTNGTIQSLGGATCDIESDIMFVNCDH